MKKFLFIAILTLATLQAKAQTILTEPLDSIPAGYEVVDSIIYTAVSRYDKDLSGKTIKDALPSNVSLSESEVVADALAAMVKSNNEKKVDGFRIRIFLDNKKNSREMSEKAVEEFSKAFPGYNAYRSFDNPFFKVTVGDFRTRADAQIAMKKVARKFPSAFIVKEKIKFPIIDLEQAVRMDTVQVLRPIAVPATPATADTK